MALALANLVLAAALTGLIWTVQLVHYPLFALAGPERWERYEAEHQRRITWLAAPLMLANAGVALALLVDRSGTALAWVDAALALGVLAATGLVFAPLHRRLAGAHHPAVITRLVRLNWLRALVWTAQVAVALALV